MKAFIVIGFELSEAYIEISWISNIQVIMTPIALPFHFLPHSALDPIGKSHGILLQACDFVLILLVDILCCSCAFIHKVWDLGS